MQSWPVCRVSCSLRLLFVCSLCTGSKDFNRLMRLYANVKFSYSLSDKALSPYVRKGADKVVSGMSIPCATEEDIFAALKLDYIPPTQRDVIPAVFLRR